ncbi:MAG TPA: hypothetical protein VFT59_03440 [Candidatus Saccharimonadales bacterium]|nr:hypothetical protein [Candidatus Saccharimonadales bacterium]
MEPKLPAPNLGQEYSPPNYGHNLESKPSFGTIETGVEKAPEQLEHRSSVESRQMPPQAVPVLPMPVTPAPTMPADDTVVADDTPLVANDDDLIEKEWVDKAKKIIVQTKDDPYRREQEVGKLQADYLLKRYGKELGASQ